MGLLAWLQHTPDRQLVKRGAEWAWILLHGLDQFEASLVRAGSTGETEELVSITTRWLGAWNELQDQVETKILSIRSATSMKVAGLLLWALDDGSKRWSANVHGMTIGGDSNASFSELLADIQGGIEDARATLREAVSPDLQALGSTLGMDLVKYERTARAKGSAFWNPSGSP